MAPTLDMVLGCYYLTLVRPGAKGEGRSLRQRDGGAARLRPRPIELQAQIKVRLRNPTTGEPELMDVTYGRIAFNQVLPEDMRYSKLRRHGPEDASRAAVLGEVYRRHGVLTTAETCDALTHLGFDFVRDCD